MRLYFAHAVTDYGTQRQADAIEALKTFWREERPQQPLEIENPDRPHHQEGYAAQGMTYFKEVVESCYSLAFMRFPNGAIGAGMGREINWALIGNKPVYELFEGRLYPVQNAPTPILTVEETRDLIAEIRANACYATLSHPEPVAQEAVAWRHRVKGRYEGAEWTPWMPGRANFTDVIYEESPLYLHPSRCPEQGEEWKALFEACQLARDEAGFLGSVPECIKCLEAETATLRARVAELEARATPPEPWELEAAAIFMDHVEDDETGSVHRVAAFLRAVALSNQGSSSNGQ